MSASASNDGGFRPYRLPRARDRGRKNHGRCSFAAELASHALSKIVPSERLALTRLQIAWAAEVPQRVQRVAWPAAWTRGGELVIHVRDNQWLHELTYLRSDLLGTLRRACPEVKVPDLRLRVGVVEVTPPPEAEPDRRAPALPAEPDRATVDALQSVDDPELRQAMANARLALSRP